MEAINWHSPIPRNGPIYRTYRDNPYAMCVYCACHAKRNKAMRTVPHGDAGSRGSRRLCLLLLPGRNEDVCFSIYTLGKKGTGCLSLPYPRNLR